MRIYKEIVATLYKLAVGVTAVSGVALLPAQIQILSGSKILGWTVSIALTLILLGSVLYHAATPRFMRRFGISRHKTRPILASDNEKVVIDENYHAKVTSRKTLIYPEVPHPDDLVDLIEVEPNEKLDESIYRSADSKIGRIMRRTGSTLAIYWIPNRTIKAFVPYHHNTVYHSPSLYGDDAFWQGFHVDLDTGRIDWTFCCPEPVELAVAFKMPLMRTRITPRRLHALTFKSRRRNAPQPLLSSDKLRVEWCLENPEKNKTYACFVFYKGGVDLFRSRIEADWRANGLKASLDKKRETPNKALQRISETAKSMPFKKPPS